jgi:hypothetical protein
MRLRDWERSGRLVAHRPSAEEMRDLLALVERDLADSRADHLSADWRMQIAYNAALQAATAALAAAGCRAVREQHHYRVIQSLSETARIEPRLVQTLDVFRKKRNLSSYERSGLVSHAEAMAMRELAAAIRRKVLAWLRREHPHLLRLVR